jgi:ABC-type multidrug transport system fused ATPase/permease subunit
MSKDPIKTLRYLKAVFIAAVGLMVLLIVATPLMVSDGIVLFDRFVFEEGAVETVLILVLFALAYMASRAYRTAVAAYKNRLLRLAAERNVLADRLTDAFRYIGTVNVQLQEIRSVFSGLKRLPENRRQFKDLLSMFGGKILGMMNVDWVTIRIVDRRILRTIIEHREVRKTQPALDPHIGNRAVVEGKPVAGYVIVTGAKANLSIVAVCILPLGHLDKEETILMQALVDEIEMLFIISNLYPEVKDDFFTNEADTVSPSGCERSCTDYCGKNSS